MEMESCRFVNMVRGGQALQSGEQQSARTDRDLAGDLDPPSRRPHQKPAASASQGSSRLTHV